MSDEFIPGHLIGAGALNRLAKTADSAHLGFAGFLASDNGFEQVVRNPRRPPIAPRLVPAAAADPDSFLVVLTGFSAGVHTARGVGADYRHTYHLVAPEVHTRGTVPGGATVIAHRVACAQEPMVVRISGGGG